MSMTLIAMLSCSFISVQNGRGPLQKGGEEGQAPQRDNTFLPQQVRADNR